MADADEFPSIHDAYVACGPSQFYRAHGRDYRNPHEPVIAELIGIVVERWNLDLTHVLDLAAGSGEVTLAIRDILGGTGFHPVTHGLKTRAANVEAIDPYTAEAYAARTGLPCETFSFEDIAAGAIRGRAYSLVVCSFAMHLCEPSRLPSLCWALAEVSPQLLILTPHKRPAIRPEWGWTQTNEIVHQRVRARRFLGRTPAS